MFDYLSGTIADKTESAVVIDVGGVGFHCTVSSATLRNTADIGSKAKIYTYMYVREDAIELFGFADKAELNCYKQLISVSGVGSKAAIAILSVLTPGQIAAAIVEGNYKSITVAQGVGPKLAQRILLELKGKITDEQLTAGIGVDAPIIASGSETDALEALLSLGYAPSEAKNAIGNMNTKDMSAEDIVRLALKFLM